MLEFLTYSDVPDSVKDVVDVIGMDAFKDLVKPIRNRMIREEFRGSYKDISLKYGISEIQVRNILNK